MIEFIISVDVSNLGRLAPRLLDHFPSSFPAVAHASTSTPSRDSYIAAFGRLLLLGIRANMPGPLAGVVLSLSGYQNPERGNMRDVACSLGADYCPDFNDRYMVMKHFRAIYLFLSMQLNLSSPFHR